MRKVLMALAMLAAFGSTADAEWKKLDGQKVPEISAKEWLNTGKNEPTTAALRGKVYLVEFFATW